MMMSHQGKKCDSRVYRKLNGRGDRSAIAGGKSSWLLSAPRSQKHADAPHPVGLLRARRKRPSRRAAAEQRDELTSFQGLHALAPRREIRSSITDCRRSCQCSLRCRLTAALGQHINQLKADADKRVERVKRETDARVERTIKEADERITQLQADAKNEIGRLQNELSQATRDINQLKADADKRVECVKRETDARVASMETSAKKRIDVIQRENEDKVLRLETDLTQAKNRANRAEQWVMLFHHEIEHRLMPSVTAMRAGPKSSNPAVSSGLLTVRTVSRSPVRTWFRRLWLQISATTAFGSRAADMGLANAFAPPSQHEPGLSNSLSVPKAGNTVTASEPST
jgi:hypothetical protein